ncbi:MAG TPA: citrate synthase [Ktedonobacterales bacterium]|jgi:citrate synthase
MSGSSGAITPSKSSLAGADQPLKGGLEEVVAASSSICELNGKEGKLSYFGIDIHDLAKYSTFEETTYLLWHGTLPNKSQLDQLTRSLHTSRELPEEVLALMRAFPSTAKPMDVLRTVVSTLGLYDPDAGDESQEANIRKAARLTAQLPTIVASAERIRNGQNVVAPRADLSQAANFLYMLTGQEPEAYNAHVMDLALILHADHEFNASTFAARVTAATLADMYSAITSALGALSGPLHGGANEQVMRMLLRMGSVDNVERYLEQALAKKEKIMGFGHRVYKTEDPRATHLRQISHDLGERAGDTKWFDMSCKVELYIKEHKGLNANVDFYSATTYYQIGIPLDLFTPIFACSRIAGWTAHVLEQYANNRLIRPLAHYSGPTNVAYTLVDQRA